MEADGDEWLKSGGASEAALQPRRGGDVPGGVWIHGSVLITDGG